MTRDSTITNNLGVSALHFYGVQHTSKTTTFEERTTTVKCSISIMKQTLQWMHS